MALHKINGFHLRYDIWHDLFQTCFYIGKMLSSKYICFKMLQMDEKRKKNTEVVNQFLLLLVTYHVILSIDISLSLFILLVLLYYILGWMGCFFVFFSEVVI